MFDKKQHFFKFLILILSAESIFLLPFVLVRIFRPTVLQHFNISNLELGSCFSLYGLVAIPSYWIGGMIADKFPAKYLLSISLLVTALIGLFVFHAPSYDHLKMAYLGWGISTILLFWSPLHKMIRLWMSESKQGRGFGGLEAGRGAIAATIGLFAATYFSQDLSYAEIFEMVCYGLIILAIAVFLLFPSESLEKDGHSLQLKQLNELEWSKVIHLGSIILVAYSAYKITDDVSLYAYDVLQLSEKTSAFVGSISLCLRPISAIIAGILADRISGNKMGIVAFFMIFIAAIVISSGQISALLSFSFTVMGIALMGIYGIRGIYFSLMRDFKLDYKGTGTAIGIMSVIGYLPDIFMSPIMGYFLDLYPGEKGHQIVFGLLALLGVFGMGLLKLQSKRFQSHQ